MYNNPLAYFITFTTYGTWLHGDCRSSVIRENGQTKILSEHPGLFTHEQIKLKSAPVILGGEQRRTVRDIIIKHCNIRQWHLFALHVRSNHIHIIVKANKPIEQVSDELKGWAKRSLSKNDLSLAKPWTRGSSKRYIFTETKLREKIHYVVYEQGEMMEYYIDEAFHQ